MWSARIKNNLIKTSVTVSNPRVNCSSSFLNSKIFILSKYMTVLWLAATFFYFWWIKITKRYQNVAIFTRFCLVRLVFKIDKAFKTYRSLNIENGRRFETVTAICPFQTLLRTTFATCRKNRSLSLSDSRKRKQVSLSICKI